MIKRVRDDHSATPRKAHKLRQMLSRLYSWANEEGLVDGYNPAAKIKRLKVRQKAITPWSEDEIARFLAAPRCGFKRLSCWPSAPASAARTWFG
jgi:integrase